MTKTLKNKKGVTLVELLAVIVILGIIAAIAVPAIGGLIDRQRENAANLSYDGVISAAETYLIDEGLAVDDTFTLADVITAGFLAESPFDVVAAADIVFTVGAAQTATITTITGVVVDTDLVIDGVTVDTIVYVAP